MAKEKDNKSNINKEIIALSDVEHVRLKPTMYIGSVEEIEEDVRVIKDNAILTEKKMISVGYYKLLNEIVDNAFDEAKRNPEATNLEIIVSFDSKTNKVSVTDTGGGFLNASKANAKTGMSNVETALSNLRAGSNFSNDNIDEAIIGTNGVGASIVNMLSDEFEVLTVNDHEVYHQKWVDFKTIEKNVSKKTSKDKRGTTISFIPLKSMFGKCKWDFDYIESQMIFREYMKSQDSLISKLKFTVLWDNVKIDLNKPFIPKNSFAITTKIGTLHIWRIQDNYFRQTSFVNTALCTGMHQNILQDVLNELFDYKYSWWYWCSAMTLNLPPKHVRFADQNKTKLASGRWEIQPFFEKHFINQLKKDFVKSSLFKEIKTLVDDEKKRDEGKELKRQLRSVKKRIVSEKYFPPSERKGTLFIVEGGCLSASTKIHIWRNGNKMTVPLIDVRIDDKVLTHNHRFKTILDVQKKLKESLQIVSSHTTYICGKKHPFYVYNIIDNKFKFVSAQDLDKDHDKIVRTRLGEFIGSLSVIDVQKISNGKFTIEFRLDNGHVWQNTDTHKYCVIENETFKMKESKDIRIGDKIANFANL